MEFGEGLEANVAGTGPEGKGEGIGDEGTVEYPAEFEEFVEPRSALDSGHGASEVVGG